MKNISCYPACTNTRFLLPGRPVAIQVMKMAVSAMPSFENGSEGK
jgi:hypothetical protein